MSPIGETRHPDRSAAGVPGQMQLIDLFFFSAEIQD